MDLSSLFQDNSGGISSTRLVFLLWTASILFIWIFLSYQKQEMVKIDSSVVTIYLGIAGYKTVQRFGEKDVPDNSAEKK